MKNCPGCGFPIRDNMRMCPVCDGSSPKPDAILEDGTNLYFKTNTTPTYASVQLGIYDMLMRGGTKNE